MARVGGSYSDAGDGAGRYAGASDARLTELLRVSTSTAYPALQELRARHHPSLLAYARLCTVSEWAARRLAAQSFTLAARRTTRGTDPGGPLRHQLLLLAGQVAAAWSADERAGGLDPGLLLVLNTAGGSGPVPPMLAPFRALPDRAQSLVWYGIVEQEPEDRTATLLGLTREDVTYGTASALQALAQACLRSRLAASDDPRCADFRRLIEESVRPDSPRDSPDLRTHMVRCAHCTAAYEEQCALRDTPRTALTEGLLPWAGTAYAIRGTAADGTGQDARTASHAVPPTLSGAWPPARRFALASAALGVALVPLLVFLLSQAGRSPSEDPVSSSGGPTSPPPVTATATATVPATTPSPSPSATSNSPSPTRSSSPPRTARPTPSPSPSRSPSPTRATPSYAPPGGTYAQVVNVASGLCLDVEGYPGNGTDVVTASCTSSRDQRWRVDFERGVLQSYAYPDYCLDSRGSLDRGIGIWECDAVDGPNGRNLRFAVDFRGVIRPGIAPDHALTPREDDSLSLVPETGRADQRWRSSPLP